MSHPEYGVHLSPNIQNAPDIYEIENLAADPDMLIEAAMWNIQPWTNGIVLDVGAGTGFHLPRFHPHSDRTIAIEPHDPSRRAAKDRMSSLGMDEVSILGGSADALPLAWNSVDLVHARFAYFFAPDCDRGVRELERVVRPGGVAFIIDNDLRSGTFASWLRRSPWVEHDPDLVEGFWRDRGFNITRIPGRWAFSTRQDLEAVVRIEFPADVAEEIIAEHRGIEVEYHYLLIHRRY